LLSVVKLDWNNLNWMF